LCTYIVDGRIVVVARNLIRMAAARFIHGPGVSPVA